MFCVTICEVEHLIRDRVVLLCPEINIRFLERRHVAQVKMFWPSSSVKLSTYFYATHDLHATCNLFLTSRFDFINDLHYFIPPGWFRYFTYISRMLQGTVYYMKLRPVSELNIWDTTTVSCANVDAADQYLLNNDVLLDAAGMFNTAARNVNRIIERRRETDKLDEFVKDYVKCLKDWNDLHWTAFIIFWGNMGGAAFWEKNRQLICRANCYLATYSYYVLKWVEVISTYHVTNQRKVLFSLK